VSGELVRIFVRPSARTPTREVEEAEACVGTGLAQDHAGGGKRQITLLSLEAWERACAELGQDLCPSARRANLVVRGLELAETRGRELQVGAVRLEIAGETRPCELLDDVALGLSAALDPEWRGGVYARVLEGGPLRVGDPVEFL
jgi:MOSC domain-containing protein YiiM